MTRTPFDQFAKQYLEELLTPYGQVEVSREIPGEARLIDLWFNPHPEVTHPPQDLGLLGQIIQTPCLLEPYRNPPDAAELNSCLLKRLWLVADCYRQGQSRPMPQLPQLWILTPTASSTILSSLGAGPSSAHPAGIYATPTAFGTFIVAIHQLPAIPETLWLRLLGRGRVQQRAIEEVLKLPESDLRFQALRLLVNWKITIDTTKILQTEEEANFMAWSQALLDFEAKLREEGRQEGLQTGLQTGRQTGRQEGRQEALQVTLYNLFLARFGEVNTALERAIVSIVNLSPEAYNQIFPQLLTLSAAELVAQFSGIDTIMEERTQ